MTAAQQVSEALAERDRMLYEVEAANPYTMGAGLEVIREWADRGQPFSLNDCRTALAAAGVTGQYRPGAVVRRAIQLGVIRKIGTETSQSRATHGKDIGRYIAANHTGGGLHTLIPTGEKVTIPVHRNHDGRFTDTTPDHLTPPLFDITPAGQS